MSEFKIFETIKEKPVLKNFLNGALKDAMSLVGAECGSLFLFDRQNKILILDSYYNSCDLKIMGLQQKLGEGITGKVFDTKTPILVKDIDNDLRFKCNGFRHYKTKSFISIPLSTSYGVIGLINIADKSSGEPFSEKDFNDIVTLIKYVCVTVEYLFTSLSFDFEKENLNKQRLLLEKYASVGKLAAGIVHEINNPLDGVIRYINILLSQVNDNSAFREYLLEANKGLKRIGNITKSLLVFSRQVDDVKIQQSKNYVDIHMLINESLEILNNASKNNIEIVKQYEEGLPKILDLGLSHVVMNIIKNAFDAMPSGGRLEISTTVNNTALEIRFKDSGLGMTNEVKDRAFEPFFTTKSIEKGTGLGLAICNEVIIKYNGKIEINSAPNHGSVFSVLIPKDYLNIQ